MADLLAIHQQTVSDQSRSLAFDYVDFYLRECGFEWVNRPNDFVRMQHDEILVMRAICLELSDHYAELLAADDRPTSILSVPLSNFEDLGRAFSKLCHDVFRGPTTTWGRIFALYAFSGLLAVECVRRGRPEEVGEVAEMLATYVQTHLVDWIASRGGWEACLQHLDAKRKKDKNIRRLAGVGAFCGALGAIALAAVILIRH